MVEVVGTGLLAVDEIRVGGEPFGLRPGGSCGNVLGLLSALGRTVAPVGALGDDADGAYLSGSFARAGADVSMLRLGAARGTPRIVEHVDAEAGTHDFTFVSTVTGEPLPRYEAISRDHARDAEVLLDGAKVLFCDRVSPGTVDLMEAAAARGMLVVFEPQRVSRGDLFDRALRVASVLKFSDGMVSEAPEAIPAPPFAATVVTRGAEGLDVRLGSGGAFVRLAAVPAPRVVDACGSGDMVTVGLVHALLAHGGVWYDAVVDGLHAGQRLATANCGCVGALGILEAVGPEGVRAILDGL